jgi:hypothetical protein
VLRHVSQVHARQLAQVSKASPNKKTAHKSALKQARVSKLKQKRKLEMAKSQPNFRPAQHLNKSQILISLFVKPSIEEHLPKSFQSDLVPRHSSPSTPSNKLKVKTST